MCAFLIVQRGEEIGRRFDLETTQLTIGRGPDNDMVLNDLMVSRYHAVIKRQGNGYQVTDLGSSNPVVINDQVLEPGVPQSLQHRDVVFIGKTVFSFQNRSGAARPAAHQGASQATQVGGSQDNDRPTPPPPGRTTPPPANRSAMDEEATRIAPSPEVPTPAATVSAPHTSAPDEEQTAVAEVPDEQTNPGISTAPDNDDDERTSVGIRPPNIPPPPFGTPPGDRLVGTPPDDEEGDLPTQIIPRR